MRIGNLKVTGQVLAAPLAGISNRAFRRLARTRGAAAVFTEMISCEGVIRLQRRTLELMQFTEPERPIGIQLFGSRPESMRDAAEIAVERYRPDFVDINFGCPVKKVVRRNEGAAALKDLANVESCVQAVVDGAAGTPVTLKMRTGWDEASPVYAEVGRIAEQNGIAAVTLHARSRARGFSGRADWSAIAALKRALSIPVIGNGDIRTPEDAARMIEETGCDAVMIGRASMGDPTIFGRVHRFLETGERVPPPSPRQLADLAREHARLVVEEYGEERGCRMMRKYLGWYVKGFPGAAKLRPVLFQVATVEDLNRAFEDYFARYPDVQQ